MTRTGKLRFDLLEVALVTVFVAVVTWQVRSAHPPVTYGDALTSQEYQRLKTRYGPSRHSEHEEEWIIRDFFHDARGGRFVDIGANHYERGSNTYYLERALGWSGLAVDPQVSFAADYARHRPRTKFMSFFVSDTSNASAKLYVGEQPLVASSNRAFTETWGKAKERDVRTITLTDLLDTEKLSQFDLLSIDVELAEPKVLGGFAIDRFRPRLVCIEAHPEVRQRILDYFAEHRYVVVGRYLRVDTANLYFQPIG